MLTLRFDLLVLWENPGYNMCIFRLLRIGNLDLHLQRIGIRTYSVSFVIASIMRNSQLVYWFESSFNTTNLLVNRLKTLPKMKATREQVKIITLYGILKSGVATSTSKVEVYMGSPNWYPFNTWESLSLKVGQWYEDCWGQVPTSLCIRRMLSVSKKCFVNVHSQMGRAVRRQVKYRFKRCGSRMGYSRSIRDVRYNVI